jgi:hypothetical protein
LDGLYFRCSPLFILEAQWGRCMRCPYCAFIWPKTRRQIPILLWWWTQAGFPYNELKPLSMVDENSSECPKFVYTDMG